MSSSLCVWGNFSFFLPDVQFAVACWLPQAVYWDGFCPSPPPSLVGASFNGRIISISISYLTAVGVLVAMWLEMADATRPDIGASTQWDVAVAVALKRPRGIVYRAL